METNTACAPPSRTADPRDPSFDTREAFFLRFAGGETNPGDGFRFQLRPGGLALWADPVRLAAGPGALAHEAGATLFDLRVTAARFGSGCDVAYVPDPHLPNLLAEIRFGGAGADESLASLFPAVHAHPRAPVSRPCVEEEPVGAALAAGELEERLRLTAVLAEVCAESLRQEALV
jgi:hypothetical protein